jgi:hypothetical protein
MPQLKRSEESHVSSAVLKHGFTSYGSGIRSITRFGSSGNMPA